MKDAQTLETHRARVKHRVVINLVDMNCHSGSDLGSPFHVVDFHAKVVDIRNDSIIHIQLTRMTIQPT